MKRPEERSIGALLMALMTLGLLAIAFSSTWFQYDFSTARNVAPDGPYPAEVTGIERDHLVFGVTGWEGDVEPSDKGLAQTAVHAMFYGTIVAGILLVVVVFAEVPKIASILRRPVSLGVITVVLLGLAAVVVVTWFWLPGSMAGLGVDSQYTASLGEEGYTHTSMGNGWYAAALGWCTLFATALFKFQAGTADPRMVEAHRVE